MCLCVQTLIRNLRDSSTRVTLVRPALWQMDTALVDQAVEKFNLKSKNSNNINKKQFEDIFFCTSMSASLVPPVSLIK